MTGNNKTWLDCMPEEIQQLIWSMVNKSVMESVILFGRYKIMFRLAIKGPMGMRVSFPRVNNDKIAKMPRISNNNAEGPILFDNGENCDANTIWKLKRWLNSGYGESSACGLLSRVRNLARLYHLCKVVDDDWENIGMVENNSASRYTYNSYADLDTRLALNVN